MICTMSQESGIRDKDIVAAIEAATRDLVAVRQVGNSSYLSLPLLYPDGSSVTLKIDKIASGIRISDNGFAYREVENIGADRSFGHHAKRIAEEEGVEANTRAVYVDVGIDELHRAICDVAAASWRIAERIYSRVSEHEETEIEDALKARLSSVFGEARIRPEHTIVGASTNPWDVSAIVEVNRAKAVFQAVSNHANSIFRTSTAFHDIARTDNPPRLVAVVQSKPALGKRLALLSQAGRVIEAGQPDEVFRSAAA